ncbi:hypothetical protein CK203_054265 [Vitis vinifera]|uniref:Uncharacterized protein n=1 Tax=Vitis vinifera TaxID=29760 RepID=A0A438GY43_VITVI|nr:hypothetical protein CK203_054265 [Vitis vinifera]
MGYINVWEHSGGGRHVDTDWSSIFEDLYSLELGNPLGCRGSACVEVMTTLHGSASSLRRSAEGCVSLEGLVLHSQCGFTILVHDRHLASIQEALASLRQEIDSQQIVQTTVLEDTHAYMDRIE